MKVTKVLFTAFLVVSILMLSVLNSFALSEKNNGYVVNNSDSSEKYSYYISTYAATNGKSFDAYEIFRAGSSPGFHMSLQVIYQHTDDSTSQYAGPACTATLTGQPTEMEWTHNCNYSSCTSSTYVYRFIHRYGMNRCNRTNTSGSYLHSTYNINYSYARNSVASVYPY